MQNLLEELSLKHYHGKPCIRCGSTVRFKSNNQCVPCKLTHNRLYRVKNRDSIRKQESLSYQQNRTKVLEQKRQYRKNNPELMRLKVAKRSYMKRSLAVSTSRYTLEQVTRRFSVFSSKCAYCLADTKLTVDHFIPLKSGGHDALYNIVPACHSCNSSKGAKNPVEWMKQRGFNDRIEILLSLVGDSHENRSSLV